MIRLDAVIGAVLMIVSLAWVFLTLLAWAIDVFCPIYLNWIYPHR